MLFFFQQCDVYIMRTHNCIAHTTRAASAVYIMSTVLKIFLRIRTSLSVFATFIAIRLNLWNVQHLWSVTIPQFVMLLRQHVAKCFIPLIPIKNKTKKQLINYLQFHLCMVTFNVVELLESKLVPVITYFSLPFLSPLTSV